MAKIFISYSHKDERDANRISEYLKNNSQKVWRDKEEIFVGESITKKIQEGLTTSDFILVLISSSSVKSGWVEKEVESKLSCEISTGKIAVLCVLCEKPDSTWTIPALLSTKKYADITDDFDSGMEDVLTAIQRHTNQPLFPPKSTTQYTNYLLGFTTAKIAGFHGNPIQLLGLKAQYKEFVSKLLIEQQLSEQILNLFRPSSNLGDVLKNAQLGVEARNTLTTVIIAQFGEKPAAAFRFGFNLVNLLSQLDFLEAAQESGSPDTPPEQLLGVMEDQFTNLYNDGTILRLPENHLSILRQAHSRSSQGQVSSVRNDLIEVGSAIERYLKTK